MEKVFTDSIEEFENIIKKNKLCVYSTALSYLANRSDADDVVQETFILAYYNFAQLRDHTKLTSWLCGIARNLSLKKNRKNKNNVPIDSIYDISGQAGPEEIYLDHENQSELSEIISHLTQSIAETITLFYLAEKSIKEIAEILDLPEGTVKWRLYDGRKKLKKELAYRMNMEKADIEKVDVGKKVRKLLEKATVENKRNNNIAAVTMCDEAIKLIEPNINLYNSLIEIYKLRARASFFTEGPKTAKANSEKSLEIARKIGDRKIIAECLLSLAFDYNVTELQKQTECLQEALEIGKEIGYDAICSETCYWLGMTAIYERQFEYADKYLDESIRYFHLSNVKTVNLCDGDFLRIRALANAAKRSLADLRKQNRLEAFCYLVSYTKVIHKSENEIRLGNNYGWAIPGTQHNLYKDVLSGVLEGVSLLLNNHMNEGFCINVKEFNYDNEQETIKYVVVSMHDVVTTKTGVFDTCLHLIVENQSDNATMHLWFAPGVGLIKKQYENRSVELTHYQVNPILSTDLCSMYFPLAERNTWSYNHISQEDQLNKPQLVHDDTYVVDLIVDNKAYISNSGFLYIV